MVAFREVNAEPSLPPKVFAFHARLRGGIGLISDSPHFFDFTPGGGLFKMQSVTVETFAPEIAEAMRAYSKYIICIDKTPEEFEKALVSLLQKAIKAYEGRGAELRHGIALDKQVTIILSQNDSPRPLCGIYFNLHSPYQRHVLPKTVKPLTETIGGTPTKSEN